MVTLVLVFAWLFVAARLICYQRRGARYRFWVSLAAYALMVGAFSRAVLVAVERAPAHWTEAIVALALAALVWRARGNVACLVRARS